MNKSTLNPAVPEAGNEPAATNSPQGSLRVACPWCHVSVGEPCITFDGRPARASHSARWGRYSASMRQGLFVVEVLNDDGHIGVLAGERYIGQLYLDPEKVTLLRRIPDGYDPQCNQYWADVRWLSWHDETARPDSSRSGKAHPLI